MRDSGSVATFDDGMDPSADGGTVAGVVLAYYPDDVVAANVALLGAQVAHVYVIDNTPMAARTDVLEALALDDAVTILTLDKNAGVAAGFNAGLRAAIAAGYEWVCIFDQDSTVTETMMARLVAAACAAGDEAGIVAPALRSAATGIVYRREAGRGVSEVDVLISSGSLFSRRVLERIGLHDEPLFIDYVDHDISLRAKRAGLRNLKVHEALLDHRFGDSDPRGILGRRVYRANYSPMRIFYQTRNRIVVVRRYGFGRWFWEDAWFTAKAWAKILLLEDDRRRKIGAAIRGAGAGLSYPARERRW